MPVPDIAALQQRVLHLESILQDTSSSSTLNNAEPNMLPKNSKKLAYHLTMSESEIPSAINAQLFDIYCRSCSPYFYSCTSAFESMMLQDKLLKYCIYSMAAMSSPVLLQSGATNSELAFAYYSRAIHFIPSLDKPRTVHGIFAMLHLAHAAFRII